MLLIINGQLKVSIPAKIIVFCFALINYHLANVFGEKNVFYTSK